jgi:hypothetical protein
MKPINKNNGVVFANERGVEDRRLGPEPGVKHAGDKALKRARSAARHGRQRLEGALHHANDISSSDQRHANQRLCVLGMVEHLTHERVVKRMPEDEVKRGDNNQAMAGLKKALGI